MIDHDPFEKALAARLARLSNMPIDMTAFDRALRSQLPSPPGKNFSWRAALRPVTAVAASLLLLAMVIFGLQGREAQASPADMARMHRDIVAGNVPTMKADSINDANRAFAAFSTQFPTLSEPPRSHTMACCMRDVGNKKVACVLLNHEGTPITMAIAATDTMSTATASTLLHHGEAYHVQTIGDLTMLTLDRNQHRLCLIGAVPAERLVALAEGLKF